MGCFDVCYPGIAPTPDSPVFIDATLYYFTAATIYTPIAFKYDADNNTINNSGFDGTKKTIIVVHGWNYMYTNASDNFLGVNINFILFQICELVNFY